MATQKLDIAIVGGGIGGLCLAIGLLKHNISVTIYEAVQNYGEVGAGVAFSPNSTRAMRLIDPSIEAALLRVATNVKIESKKDIWMEFRHGQDLPSTHPNGPKKTGDLVGAIRCPDGQATSHRAGFLAEVVKLIPPGNIKFGKRLQKIEELGDGGVLLHFRDGTTATHAAMVGCDGIKSAVRPYILGDSDPATSPQWAGKYVYRCVVPMDDAVSAIGEDLAFSNSVWIGPHSHLTTFPVNGGAAFFISAFQSREKWEHENWVIDATKEELLHDFQWCGPLIQSMLPLINKLDIWALFDHPPARTYYKGNVCMIGDAAHATTPFQGAGAGMAVEDAYVLSSLLATMNAGDKISDAFKAYDVVRRPRTQKLVSTSREAGHLWDHELEGVGDDYDKIRENAMTRMHWIWDEDLPQEVVEGRKIMTQG